MLASERMTSKIIAVRPRDSVERARELMQRHDIRHLPVLHGRTIAGIVSDRDLRRGGEVVADVMTAPALTISPDTSVDEAASVMQRKRFSALLVVEGKRLLGILTTADVLKAFVDLSGVAESTTRVIVFAKGVRDAEAKIRGILHHAHADLKWLQRQGPRFHLRVKAKDIDDVVTALESADFDVSAVITSGKR